MTTVAIVDGSYLYSSMFVQEGFQAVFSFKEADFVCFTGGPDVSPHLYGEQVSLKTRQSSYRDEREKEIFDLCLAHGTPMVGICRGAQFLNVMCGGKMWQDVDGHTIGGTHSVKDLVDGKEYRCTSTHHQMMRPSSEATIIALADESTSKMHMNGPVADWYKSEEGQDVEVVTYPEQNVLCFQPHPEMYGNESCTEYFFKLLERELEIK